MNIKAAIFDLDGVITKTAVTHCHAWKEMFDEYLHFRADKFHESFVPFSSTDDYKQFVDGRPRYEGVQSFLESRNIHIPYGEPSDNPGYETVCSLGNMKNIKFNDIINRDGVELFDSTIRLIQKFRNNNIKVAVASSSRNCKPILKKMQLIDLFEVCVDGNDLAELNLRGKPDPAIFTTAADLLEIDYDSSVVFEDAISGVQAAHKGNFGLVVGIARELSHKEMKDNGADFVVDDLGEIDVDDLDKIMLLVKNKDGWEISFNNNNNLSEKCRESLFVVGNGYFCCRGINNFFKSSSERYHATYLAGVYNRLETNISGKSIQNEDLVNCGELWDIIIKYTTQDSENQEIINVDDSMIVISNYQTLFLRSGLLETNTILEDSSGNKLLIKTSHIISMYDHHAGSIKYSITPLNYSGKFYIQTGINCNVTNNGVERYNQLNNKHLNLKQTYLSENSRFSILGVETETNNSHIKIGIASKIVCKTHDCRTRNIVNNADNQMEYAVFIEENKAFIIEKIITLYNSKQDEDYSFCNSIDNLKKYNNYIDVLENSDFAWKNIWTNIDITISNDRERQRIIRLYLYQLMTSFSEHNKKLDAGFGPRGLTGEAYRGHMFWDELFVMPFYAKHFPESAKAMLMYRYRRLAAAKEAAREANLEGAMFPWQSGSDGREESQSIHLNPISGKWDIDLSHLQYHVSLAIAYNISQYFEITSDETFMIDYGMELLYEICRFWASKTQFDENSGRYHIFNVMGPDEFHEKYHNCIGVNDNAYTNIMVSWLFEYIINLNNHFSTEKLYSLHNKLNINNIEFDNWIDISKNLFLEIKGDIIAQFDGFFDLKEIDFQAYRKKYNNIERFDRILKAEGHSSDEYQVCKQADLMMAFYLLSTKMTNILHNMRYELSDDYLDKNFDYYFIRTSHGSTLSKVVYANIAKNLGRDELSRRLYREALVSDYYDTQGTTGEGTHIGVMCSTAEYNDN